VAATPPGLTVTIKAKLEQIEGRTLVVAVVADDGVDKISEGIHERFVIYCQLDGRMIDAAG
jgi:fluoroacetyl-CoA thioesterase